MFNINNFGKIVMYFGVGDLITYVHILYMYKTPYLIYICDVNLVMFKLWTIDKMVTY